MTDQHCGHPVECITGHTTRYCQMCALEAEVTALKSELAEICEEVVVTMGDRWVNGEYAGWWDTMALGLVHQCGDRLVELGKWERHPEGVGRRWWYRPIKREDR